MVPKPDYESSENTPLELDVWFFFFLVVEAYMSECVNENAKLETDPMKCLDTTAAIFQHKLLHLAAKALCHRRQDTSKLPLAAL